MELQNRGSIQRNELQVYLDQLLDAAHYRDYCPNGLQVEGRAQIARIVCGVTASQALLDAAAESGADAVLVHHGLFWKGEDGRVTGHRKARLKRLLTDDINLYAYHLPLDAHATLGNNAQLAKRLGWTATGQFGDQNLGLIGEPDSIQTAQEVAANIEALLGRAPMLIGEKSHKISRMAWCSGAAQDMFEAAIAAGADAFMSGEISERTVHLAREYGVPYLAAGHHATERFGVMALGEHLTEQFGLVCEFVEIANPV